MIAMQSNATQAVNDNESNKNYPTDKPVAQTVHKRAQACDQDTENVLETSPAKQKRGKRMKNFDMDFQTKMQLEQVRFQWRKLELEMHMKELETKYQQLQKSVSWNTKC